MKEYAKIKVRIEGVRPLLTNNPQLVDYENPLFQERANQQKIVDDNKKRKGGDENILLNARRRMDYLMWKALAYWDADHFYIPAAMVLKSLRDAAAKTKQGKKVEQGVWIASDPNIPVKSIPKKKTLDEYYEDPSFKLRTPVRVPPKTGAMVIACRPMLPTGWVIEPEFEYDDEVIAPQTIEEAGKLAGFAGLGSWRPQFGKFLFEVI